MLAGLTSTEEREELEALIRFRESVGRSVPDDIRSKVARVEVDKRHEDMMQAFLELSGARAISSAGLCPIACADVAAWCSLHGVEDDLRPTYWRVLHRVDGAFLERVRERHR